jgi:hypothetical protein
MFGSVSRSAAEAVLISMRSAAQAIGPYAKEKRRSAAAMKTQRHARLKLS